MVLTERFANVELSFFEKAVLSAYLFVMVFSMSV